MSVRLIVLIALVIFVGGSWLWWQKVHNSPKNVFEAMLNNSLRTRGLTRHTVQSGDLQQLDQHVRLQSGQQAIAQSRTTLTQGAVQNPDASVKTESIGTPAVDYIRYVDIQTTQRNKDGQAFDFGEVLNRWGVTATDSLQTDGELFGEASLGVIPTGYLAPSKRAGIVKLIHDRNIYQIDYQTVERSTENGRPRYAYKVKANPEDYLIMLKEFAAALGLTQLKDLQPETYRGSAMLEFSVVVDVWSRQLVSLDFAASGRTETYSSYGARTPVELPTDTISVQELQLRLQTVQ